MIKRVQQILDASDYEVKPQESGREDAINTVSKCWHGLDKNHGGKEGKIAA